MDRKQVKEILPILVAFAEGKVIECRTKPSALSKSWQDMNEWTEIKDITYWNNMQYRIKPDSKAEAKYRPFANAEECWAEMSKHSPFGWVKDKQDGHRALITAVDDDTCGMSLNGNAAWSLSAIMDLFTFVDGTPFGVKVENSI